MRVYAGACVLDRVSGDLNVIRILNIDTDACRVRNCQMSQNDVAAISNQYAIPSARANCTVINNHIMVVINSQTRSWYAHGASE